MWLCVSALDSACVHALSDQSDHVSKVQDLVSVKRQQGT